MSHPATSAALRHGIEPLAQDYTVVYRNTEGTSRGLDGPGLVKLPDGSLVAVVPVKMPDHWVCQVLRSGDAGETWKHLSGVPYYSAVPWVHDGTLYLFAHTEGQALRNDDMHLLRSEDGGANWSEPVTIARGHFWNCQTGMVLRDGKVYWAVDDLSPGPSRRGPRVVCGDLSGDPMDAGAWRISNLVEFPGLPDSLLNPHVASGYPSARMLEPNVIEVSGRLRVLMTVKPPMQATTNLAAVFDVQDEGDDLSLSFTQYHPLPGGQLKFCTSKDEQTGLLWMTGNFAADGQDMFGFRDEAEHRNAKPYNGAIGGNDRRLLMLSYSLDGLNWFPAGCVARAGRLSQSFNYPSHVIDGQDLLIISRSSVHGQCRHDADCATFHRVRKFRELALNLWPDPT